MASVSKIDHFARQIATKLSRGKLPLTAEMAKYIEERPESLFDSLDGFARHVGDGIDERDALAAAYLMLMGLQLELLRYESDRDYEWARDMQAEFERRLVSLAGSGDLPGPALTLIAGVMHEAKLRPGADLLALNEDLLQADAGEVAASDKDALLAQLASQAGDDVFALLEQMDKATHAMPPELRATLAEQMVTSPFQVLKEAAPLAILDAEKAVRRRIASLLLGNAGELTPAALRRLIAVRTWLPEDERDTVDQVVRAARAGGVVCAGWDAGSASDVRASVIDGSGAHGLMIVSPAGRRQILSSILLKQAVGVLDAWSAPPSPKREIAQMLKEANASTMLAPISSDYLDLAVRHHLAVGLENHRPPPVGLLQVAETVRAMDWRPARLDWQAALEGLMPQMPAFLCEPAEIVEILETSADVAAAYGLSDSWFEDDQQVDDLLRKTRTRQPERLLRRVLNDVIEPRKLKWAERFLWIALWLKEEPDGPDALWPLFAILARELSQGRRAETIPLMEEIALQTIMAMDR